MEIITAINAAIGLLEVLIPQLAQLFKGGQITADQQQAVLDRINALRKSVNEGFSGPEWEQSTKDNPNP